MTVGSNRNGSSQDGSTHTAIPLRDGRETLSALFDGELHGDAARFALKRLDHDVEWRESCGRWQLIGDAMRGEATALAPVHFAEGVMRALEAGPAAAVPLAASSTQAVPRRAGRRWIGGAALAASVAIAAVLAVRPSSSPEEPAGPVVAGTTSSGQPSPQVASATVAPAPATVPASGPANVPIAVPSKGSAGPEHARTLAAAGPERNRPAHRVGAPEPAPASPLLPAAGDQAEAVAATASAQSPFHPPGEPVIARPWPRAVLPDAAPGGLTVGFGHAPAPSLYPFEPRLPAEADSAEPQR